jgi:uncharacterized protein YciI
MAGPNITKDDIMAATQKMLQMHLYVINTTPVNGMGPVMETLEEHLQFQISLEQKGIMLAAGPLWADDEHSWNGEGMVIIRAESLSAARAIAESDPMHASGARSFTVRPWMVNEGRVNITLDFSTGDYAFT